MSENQNAEYPNKMWYVGHFFFWIITGLICYIVWKDKNPEAAKKHLIHSIWIGLIGLIISLGFGFIIGLGFEFLV